MALLEAVLMVFSCLVMHQAMPACYQQAAAYQPAPEIGGSVVAGPRRAGEAIDVVLTAEAALAWDVRSGETLYERQADERRAVASLSKLLSALVVREKLALNGQVEIGAEAVRMQRLGVHVNLPLGDQVQASELLAAGMIASANDAMVALAVAVSGSEDVFVEEATAFGRREGLHNTRLANATGLSGGEQYSSARDVMKMMRRAYDDPILRSYLTQAEGVLTTSGGVRRSYKSTNRLLDTYLPVRAAKTGYTHEAKENVVVITSGAQGQEVGIVIP